LPSSLLGAFPISSYHSFVGYQNPDSIKMLCLYRVYRRIFCPPKP
jgi:hypothetical protein